MSPPPSGHESCAVLIDYNKLTAGSNNTATPAAERLRGGRTVTAGKPTLKKRLPFLLPAAAALIFAAFFLYTLLTADARRFARITEEFFSSSLSGDSLSLHYTLADPSPYLDPPSPALLPVYTTDGQRETGAALENFLAALREINPRRLNRYDRYTLSLLIPYLENELAGTRCEYFEEPLSPTSGMHTQLLILLAEYTFRTGQDLEDYMDILESVPAYLEGLAQYEKEKAAAGLFMSQSDAAAVVKQCDRIMDLGLLEDGSHFLQVTFSERLDGLIASGIIDASQKEALISEDDRLLRTVVAPAYVALADDIFLLSDTGCLEGSVCQAAGGSAYYTYLLRRNTGTGRTPEEVNELLSASFQSLLSQLQDLLARYREQTGQVPQSLSFPAFPLQEPQEILTDLQERISADFPAVPALPEGPFTCTTKTVDSSMEEYTSPAFYLTPPLDDLGHNVIYINNASTPPGLELYTTLAHEGYPGHLYQTVYSQSYENASTNNPIRHVLSYGGYVEGWAYYVENLSYDYAAELLAQNGATEDDLLLVQVARLERNLQVNLYCLLDLAIHYYGAGRQDVFRSLSALGITQQETAASIYNYIRMEPTTYLKYYLGYLEILSLQEQARGLWGDAYTPLRFHTFLLQAGPSDFGNLERLLKGKEKDTAGEGTLPPSASDSGKRRNIPAKARETDGMSALDENPIYPEAAGNIPSDLTMISEGSPAPVR